MKHNYCNVNSKESEEYHSTGSPMDGAPPGSKTNRDHLMKDSFGSLHHTTIITYLTIIAMCFTAISLQINVSPTLLLACVGETGGDW